MTQQTQTPNNKHRPARRGLLSVRFLLVYLLFVALVSGVSLSRYQSTLTATATVTVARPAISLHRNDTVSLIRNSETNYYTFSTLPKLQPGDVLKVTYTVSNVENGLASQVKMSYALSVSNGEDLSPLIINWSSAAGSLNYGEGVPVNTHELTLSFPATHTDPIAIPTREIMVKLDAQQQNN